MNNKQAEEVFNKAFEKVINLENESHCLGSFVALIIVNEGEVIHVTETCDEFLEEYADIESELREPDPTWKVEERILETRHFQVFDVGSRKIGKFLTKGYSYILQSS